MRVRMRCTAFRALILVGCTGLALAEVEPSTEYVQAILNGMSLRHKIGQMIQINIDEVIESNTLQLNTTRCDSQGFLYSDSTLYEEFKFRTSLQLLADIQSV